MGRLIDVDEEWVDIVGFPKYEISDKGNIRCKKTKKVRAVHPKGKYGHAQISLYKDGKNHRFQVHRLVAMHFIPNPENKPEVCHIDNTLGENGLLDNSASNLMWGTHKENCQFWNTRKRQSENHADVSGKNNPNYGKCFKKENKEKLMKMYGRQVLQWEDGRVVAFYESLKDAGRKIGISWTNIKNVCDGIYVHAGGYEWSYVCKPYDPEKVVEQLENERKFWENAYDSNLGKEKARSYEHAIEIVKGGGKEKDISTCAKDDIEKDLC